MTSESEPEWLSKPVTERLAHAFTTSHLVDVELSIPFMGKRYDFKAHKNILALHSTAFERQFYGDGRGGDQLTRIHPQGLSYVLRLIYNVPNIFDCNQDKAIILTAYHAAKTLGMKQIEDMLRERIFNRVINVCSFAAEDFWKLLELSRILKLEDIVQNLLKYSETHTTAILTAASFVKASIITVTQVLHLDNLSSSEMEVLESITVWYRANNDIPFAKSFLEDLLMCVRFRNLSSKEFKEFMEKNKELMSKLDALKILTHLTNPSLCTLPLWCCTKFRRLGSSCHPTKEKENALIYGDKTSFKISSLLSTQKFSDVCFTVLRGQSRRSLIRIRAHRNILAMGSYVFNRMFFGPFPDARPVIEITTAFPQGFETMIRYFYDDSDPDSLFTSSNLAFMTSEVALKYGSNKLRNTCLDYFKEDSVKPNTFWKLLEYRRQPATKTDQSSLVRYLNYATQNSEDIFKNNCFLKATKFAIIEVLKLNSLSMKEIDVLEYVARWLEYDRERLNQSKYDLLRHIRFNGITYQEFIAFLARHAGFFTEEESFSILKYTLGSRKYGLPKWCYYGPARNSFQNALVV